MALSTWLDKHLEEFVRPHLKYIPNVDPTYYYISVFDKRHLAALKAVWDESKKRSKGRQILLPGRDVWLLEVLARMEDYFTIFRPDISSISVDHRSLQGLYTDCYLVDTGNRGTIARKLGIKNFALIYCSGPWDGTLGGTHYNKWMKEHQLFPHRQRGPVYNLYSYLESCDKYWYQAGLDGSYAMPNTKITQGVDTESIQQYWGKDPNNRLTQFNRAAQITQHVAKIIHPRKRKLFVLSTGRGV